jgi:hypothetical protein
MVAACGGNVAGNWMVSSSCYEINGALGGTFCPNGTITAHATYSGTFTFGTDSTYSMALSVSANEVLWFPAACLTSQGVTTTCEQLTLTLMDQVAGSGISSIQCTASARGGCDCIAVASQPIPPAVGTYASSGATLTLAPNDGTTPNNFGYCATTNQLDLLPPSMTSDGLAATGDIMFVRQ